MALILPVDRSRLVRELRALRGGEGRTLVKLLRSPTIRAALGDPPEGQLLARFDTAVTGLGGDIKSRALLYAYAIGLTDPMNLTERRIAFGAKPEVARQPDTIHGWENEQIEELAARLLADEPSRGEDHIMVAAAVAKGMITVLVEGWALPGRDVRHSYNPADEPFLPALIYQLRPFVIPKRLTLSVVFLDQRPAQVFACASSDLYALVIGAGKIVLDVEEGGIADVEAVAHVAGHWNEPQSGTFYCIAWE